MDNEVKEKFQSMQLKHDARYILFNIEDKKTIKVHSVGERNKTYADFLAALPATEPRYCLVDVDYDTVSGAKHTKLVFIYWCPDDCAVRDKMLYASSKDTIKKAFQGVQLEIQANDNSDIDNQQICEKLRR